MSNFAHLYEYSEQEFASYCEKVKKGTWKKELEDEIDRLFTTLLDVREISFKKIPSEFIEERKILIQERLLKIRASILSDEMKQPVNAYVLLSLRTEESYYQFALDYPYRCVYAYYGIGDDFEWTNLTYCQQELAQEISAQDRDIRSMLVSVEELRRFTHDFQVGLEGSNHLEIVELLIIHLSRSQVGGYEHEFDEGLTELFSISQGERVEAYMTDFVQRTGEIVLALNDLTKEQKRMLLTNLSEDIDRRNVFLKLIEVLKTCKKYSSDTIFSSDYGGWEEDKMRRLLKIFDGVFSS